MFGSPTRLAWLAAALTVASLAPKLGGEWVYDDYPYVVENPDLSGGPERALRLFTVSFPSHAPERGLYRPVTALSYRLDRLGGAPRPIVSQLVNLALAGSLVLLVFALLRRLVGDPAAAAGTLLFAAHPVHVEAFAWVAGRSEILAALGGGLAFVLALDVARGRGGILRAVVAGACLLLGFLAKENAAMFLPLAAIAMARPGGGGASDAVVRRPRLLALGALALALAVGVVARVLVLGAWAPAAGERVGEAALASRWPLILAATGEHLRLLVAPFPLSLERMTRPPIDGGDPRVWTGALIVALFVGVAVACVRRPAWRTLAWWPLVALVPVMHLVPIGETVAERFLLVPSIGFAGLLGAALFGGPGTRSRGARRVLLGLLVAAGFLGSAAYARTWRWEEDVWRHALKHEPNAGTAWTALGDAYARRDWPDKAVTHYRHALEIDPGLTVARLALAQALDRLGRPDLALEEAVDAVRRDADHPVALNHLGARLARTGRVEEAGKMFRRAVELAPGYAPALRNAALAALEEGRPDEAERLLGQARDADPGAPGLDLVAERIRAARN